MTTLITTSTAATATAYSNQRKMDRTSNGVLWMLYWYGSGTGLNLNYSTDNGMTWVNGGAVQNGSGSGTQTYAMNGSLFIDQDDYAHVVFKDNQNGFIYYRRGTPNADRTSWTWSTASQVNGYPGRCATADLVAHREGTGWKVHIVGTWDHASGNSSSRYRPVTISNTGTITLGTEVGLPGSSGLADPNTWGWHSIDFNHTGDGKTVAGSAPHLYVAWSSISTSQGIRFVKATYSAGTWTWGTEREIDAARYIDNAASYALCMFDGTRVVIAGRLRTATAGVWDLMQYERDVADTSTVMRILAANISTGDGLTYLSEGSATYDASGNVYFVGMSNTTPVKITSRKWVRDTGTGTLEAPVIVDGSAKNPPYVSAKRGSSGGRVEFIYTDGAASPYDIKYSYVGDPNPELYPATIATSTASTANAYSNQRKVDRCQNGVLWTMFWDGTSTTTTSMDFYYSTDNGTTWAKGGEFGFASTGTTYTPNASWFIDLDDYAHVVYKDRSDGFIYYRRGTPNAGRTSWTWSAATTLASNTTFDYPDVVAHREGTGWKAHAVVSRNQTAGTDVLYCPLTITSGGAITLGTTEALAANYGNTVHKWPSIDFNHTGDGKTVAGSIPHLYVAWSAGATGAGLGIRFKKATYSGGTWTWGTEREIDSTRYISATTSPSRWMNCLFDGTRVIMMGHFDNNAGELDVVLYDRDAADTATTTRVLVAATGVASANVLSSGSATYDANGNVYLFGGDRTGANGTRTLAYRKWVRATTTLGSIVVIETSASDTPRVSAKRGYSNNRIEFIYTDGTASPYNVTYSTIEASTPPTLTVPGDISLDPRVSGQITWTTTGQQQYSVVIKPYGGTAVVNTTVTSSNNYHTLAANTLTDDLNYEVTLGVFNGLAWTYKVFNLFSSSWVYVTEVVSSSASGNITMTNATAGEYEVQVRTADAGGFGAWSSSALTYVTDVMAYIGGTWKATKKQFRHWSDGWKDQVTTKF